MRKMSNYENFIAVSRYARWREADMRRETWTECVDRYISFFKEHLEQYGVQKNDEIFTTVRTAILNRDVMPSMRALMSAGEPLRRNHMASYNCSFVAIDNTRCFDEIMFILMSGTGVGFSVERKSVEQLPAVPKQITDIEDIIVVGDSREGWASSFRSLIESLYSGYSPEFDFSHVRPSGARLVVFGGRASGPEPLMDLFNFTKEIFKGAVGRNLSPLEVHDLICKVGDVVVSGGVRRSALISLSDLTNPEMARAKSGAWWETAPHRALANNSAVYTQKPTAELFLSEFLNLIESQSGERGIFNLEGVKKLAPERRDSSLLGGTNPCGEITLRSSGGLCNLTEVVIRAEDTESDILYKVQIAAILGTWQASLTGFTYVRSIWKENAEEEALLGVSLTGIYGNQLYSNPFDAKLPRRLESLKKRAVLINEEWADRLGISRSASVTTVKPSGTVSQLVGTSSGIHPHHSPYYIRRVRGSNDDPLTRLMKDSGVPFEPDVTNPSRTTVFSFPVKAPEGAVMRDDVSALKHLELYRIYRESWAEHQVSITVTVRPEEWVACADWVWKNWDSVAGISFLPHSQHTYQQSPYEEITEAQYKELVAESPGSIRFSDLAFYETADGTTGNQTLACSADHCEVVDLT